MFVEDNNFIIVYRLMAGRTLPNKANLRVIFRMIAFLKYYYFCLSSHCLLSLSKVKQTEECFWLESRDFAT